MIYNYWVEVSNAFKGALNAKFVSSRPLAGPPWMVGAPEVSVNSVQFPMINTTDAATSDILIGRAKEDDARFTGYEILNLYSNGSADLSSQVVVRETLQEWEDSYPDDFRCVGAWEWGGQPIGGVGSPWFQTPPEIKGLGDVILRAGQARRQFV